MLEAGILAFERSATIVGNLYHYIHQIDAIEVMGAGHKFLIVMRPCSSGHGIRLFFPACAAVGAFINASGAAFEFNGGINYIGLLGRDGQTNLSHILRRQSFGQFLPVFATVVGAIYGCSRPSSHIGSHSAMALPGGSIEPIWITRVDEQIGGTGPLVTAENLLPCVAAISCFENTTLAALAPQRPLSGYPNRFGIVWVNNDFGNVFRIFETFVGPRFAGILTQVNAIAVAHMPAAHIFAGTSPDALVVRWINGQATNGIGSVIIENGIPGGA